MDVRGMHYDFKQKMNKIDSQEYRNLRVPEIDWKLNEAYEIFVKSIAEPRTNRLAGFEVNQRTIDDLRTIVVNNNTILPLVSLEDTKEITIPLPSNYMFYLSSTIQISKVGCGKKEVRATLIQHDDENEESIFYTSSYEWGEVNIRFFEGGIKVFTDGTFKIDKLKLNYIKKHDYIHNAQDFLPTQSYTLPNGVVLVGSQNCELPEHTHREIVDIAVLITSGELLSPGYKINQAKIKLNN